MRRVLFSGEQPPGGSEPPGGLDMLEKVKSCGQILSFDQGDFRGQHFSAAFQPH